jgi:hypothetical protein
MIGKLRPLALSYEADVLSALSPEDRTQLDRLIDKLLQNT